MHKGLRVTRLRTLTSPPRSSPAGHASTYSITFLATLLEQLATQSLEGQNIHAAICNSESTDRARACLCPRLRPSSSWSHIPTPHPTALLRYAIVHLFKLIRARPKHKASSTSNSPVSIQTTWVYHDNNAVFVHATSTSVRTRSATT
jgi:hypothetical protein